MTTCSTADCHFGIVTDRLGRLYRSHGDWMNCLSESSSRRTAEHKQFSGGRSALAHMTAVAPRFGMDWLAGDLDRGSLGLEPLACLAQGTRKSSGTGFGLRPVVE